MKEWGAIKPVLPTVKEIIVANAAFEQGLFQRTIRHAGQRLLSMLLETVKSDAVDQWWIRIPIPSKKVLNRIVGQHNPGVLDLQ